VSSFRGIKWFLVLMLALTLGWKWVVHGAGFSSDPGEESLQSQISEFLTHHQFAVAPAEEILEGEPLMSATRGSCRLVVFNSPASGWDRDIIRTSQKSADRTFFVFDRKVFTDHPSWPALFDFLWTKFLRELGFRARPTPILAIVASRDCGAERLPWNEVS
jgi:hypothetical protein